MATLIKIDRNGSKHYEGNETCPRCDGKGIYYIGVCNGELVPSWVDNGICFQCGGSGVVYKKWIERTPEYQAKLDARREAKHQKWLEDHAEEIAAKEAKEREEREAKLKEEAERKAREDAEREELERLEAIENQRKANSKFVGNIKDKIECELTYRFTASFEASSFVGYKTVIMHIHNFVDADGNTFIWKTEGCLAKPVDSLEYEWEYPKAGTKMMVKGTIKDHNEYKGEKQTVLTRCKVVW